MLEFYFDEGQPATCSESQNLHPIVVGSRLKEEENPTEERAYEMAR